MGSQRGQPDRGGKTLGHAPRLGPRAPERKIFGELLTSGRFTELNQLPWQGNGARNLMGAMEPILLWSRCGTRPICHVQIHRSEALV